MYSINFSDNIARLRRERKITQEQLADFVGITKASVSKWETGQSMPDVLMLPQLATFFDVTIDELLRYEPQLSNEQMKKIYLYLSAEFATNKFENVMEKSEKLVKQYYSCYQFLYRMSLLWINHFMLTEDVERQKEILSNASKLCVRIMKNSSEIGLCNDALHLNASITLLLGDAKSVIDSLEDIMNPCHISNQSAGVLIKAYQMINEKDKADNYTQITMYSRIMDLLSCATEYITIHSDNLSVCEETLRRIQMVSEAYDIEHLHPSTISMIYYQAAIVYCIHGRKEEGLSLLKKFICCLEYFFRDGNTSLHGDEYFNKLYIWFEQLELGGSAPRDKNIMEESVVQALNHPAFVILEEDEEFQRMKEIFAKKGNR